MAYVCTRGMCMLPVSAKDNYVCKGFHHIRNKCTIGRYHRFPTPEEQVHQLPISKVFYCEKCLRSPNFADEVESFLRKYRHSIGFDPTLYKQIIEEFHTVFGTRRMKKAMELVDSYKDL